MQRVSKESGRSILQEEFEKGETTQTGPGAPLDEVIDPATKKLPEESARRLEDAHARPGAKMIAHEHEISEHSYWPIVLAIGLFIVGVGFVSSLIIVAIGAAVVMASIIGWMWEPWVA
jgi:hypothetical protein